MNYWVVSPNVTNEKSQEDKWKELIVEKGIACMGYNDDHDLGKAFINKVKIGDFVLIGQGANINKKLFLGGVVKTESKYGQLEGMPSECNYRELTQILSKEILDEAKLNFDKNAAFGESKLPGSIYQLYPEKNSTDKSISLKINELLTEQKINEKMENLINILKFKKQIILQGAPGTGKTYTAKKIAEVMTAASKIKNYGEMMDNFIKNFDSKNPEVIANRADNQDLMSSFHKKFPKDSLKNLSLETYCNGKGEKGNFCWWIENGLKMQGIYSPGFNQTYLISWKKDSQKYEIYRNLLKLTNDENEAIGIVAKTISELVNEENIKAAQKIFSNGFILKVLNSYFPEKYFPVYQSASLNNILSLFNADFNSLSDIEKNKTINELFLNKRKSFNSDVSNTEFMQFLFDEFNPRKTIEFKDKDTIIVGGEYKLIQFHPAYSYEDFVRGIIAESDDNGQIKYTTKNKVLIEFALKAQDNPSSNYVLIIDEINRANLPSVLGELIYALEYRDEEVESMYSINDDFKISLPPNLYIIGTMNTADRSVGHIDYAIRRRFAFHHVEADESVISLPKAKKLFKTVSEILETNKVSDFELKDIEIGHSYYIAVTDEELKLKLDYEIKPLLHEYLKDGLLLNGEITKNKIDALNV